MINHDDTKASLDSLTSPNGVVSAQSISLSPVMDKLQEAGLLGLGPEKRKAALKELSPEQVKDLQKSLVDAGFKDVGSIDGIAGKNTLKGIEQALAKNTLAEVFAEADASDKETVRRIQDSLNTLGLNAGTEDGVLGPNTAKAVGRYLNEEGLGAGSVPENVRGKIKEYAVKLDSETPIELPVFDKAGASVDPAVEHAFGVLEQTEADVKAIQAFLKDKNYYDGKIDGDFGPNTTKGFVKFLEENPQYHAMMGPTSIFVVEIAAADKAVAPSDELKKSLNLRDISRLPTPTDELRYQAYKDYFTSEGKPVELARGIKVAAEMTGKPMDELFVVMKQESINFGDYNPRHGNSSANRVADNYGQFTTKTKAYMDRAYGDDARRELAREGIAYDPKEDWRNNPLVAPYMVAKYLQETGSYPAYVLPAMRGKENSSAVVASKFPDEAASNPHILGGGRSFKQARLEIEGTLKDDIRAEREIVRQAQIKALKDDLLDRGTRPILDDTVDPKNRVDGSQDFAGLVGDKNNPEAAVASLNFKGAFAKATDLLQIADISPDGKGPKPSGWAPTTNDFA